MRLLHSSLFVASLSRPLLAITTGDNKPHSKDARIAVVGGGYSGVYAAYRLKKLGYNDITIFEKADAVGGKTQTLHDGMNLAGHDTGTAVFTYGYDWPLRLVDELGLPMYLLKSRKDTVRDQDFHEYAHDPANKPALESALKRYEELRAEATGLYRNEETGQFTYNYFSDISDAQIGALANVTFKDWIDKHSSELEPLRPVFNAFLTSYLYGLPQMVSALHGLDWVNPTALNSVIDYFINPEKPRLLEKMKPAGGFQSIVAAMVHKGQLKVIYNVNIRKINRNHKKRCSEDCVKIVYSTPVINGPVAERFDFLVSSVHPHFYDGALKFYGIEDELFAEDNWETNTLTLTTITSNEDNRTPWFDILRLKDFPPQILAPKGLYPTWDFGMCINRKPIIADGEVSVAGIGKCTKVPGNEPGTFVPSKDCTIYDHSMISDLVTCYTEKFGVPLSSNGVALSVQFDADNAEDVVKMTEGNYGVKLTDVKRQNRRDYFNRYKIEKVAQGYTKKLFEHSLNNKRFTWYVGGYAAYESLMKISDHIEVILERTGTKPPHQGLVFDESKVQSFRKPNKKIRRGDTDAGAPPTYRGWF